MRIEKKNKNSDNGDESNLFTVTPKTNRSKRGVQCEAKCTLQGGAQKFKHGLSGYEWTESVGLQPTTEEHRLMRLTGLQRTRTLTMSGIRVYSITDRCTFKYLFGKK